MFQISPVFHGASASRVAMRYAVWSPACRLPSRRISSSPKSSIATTRFRMVPAPSSASQIRPRRSIIHSIQFRRQPRYLRHQRRRSDFPWAGRRQSFRPLCRTRDRPHDYQDRRGRRQNWKPANVLADPTLDIADASGSIIASDDNWRDTQEDVIIASTIPPTNDLESAIDLYLMPGNYTAIVRGSNNDTGNALVEFHELP